MSYRRSQDIDELLKAYGSVGSFASHVALAPSYEGRPISALRIHVGNAVNRPAVLLLGGMHGNELMIPGILTDFISGLYTHTNGWSIDYQGETVRSWEPKIIQGIRQGLDIVVLPNANPDGREHAFDHDRYWRKNRRPFDQGIGVDLNRNFDHDPEVPSNPTMHTYSGPYAFSEVETQNVRALLAMFRFECMIDLHAPLGLVLYPFGRYLTQMNDSHMGGYMHSTDLAKFESIGQKTASALMEVGKSPVTSLGIKIDDPYYASGSIHSRLGPLKITGSSIDYAYASSIVGFRPTVYGFGLDIGDSKLVPRGGPFDVPVPAEQPSPKLVAERFTPQAHNGILTILAACASGVFSKNAPRSFGSTVFSVYDIVKAVKIEP